MLADLIDDTLNVIRATKIAPKRIVYYTAASWKRKIHNMILMKAEEGEVKIGEIMKAIGENPQLKPHMRDAAAFVLRVIKNLNKLPRARKTQLLLLGDTDDTRILTEATTFLKDRFNCEITVYGEEDEERYDPKDRARMAMPIQPAIYME
jgi:leucyl-tRNA synthetase